MPMLRILILFSLFVLNCTCHAEEPLPHKLLVGQWRDTESFGGIPFTSRYFFSSDNFIMAEKIENGLLKSMAKEGNLNSSHSSDAWGISEFKYKIVEEDSAKKFLRIKVLGQNDRTIDERIITFQNENQEIKVKMVLSNGKELSSVWARVDRSSTPEEANLDIISRRKL